jgi:hypothetical protein
MICYESKKSALLLVTLAALAGACGGQPGGPGEAAEKAESTDPEALIWWCNQATCSAAGGHCVGRFCAQGCENSPLSCTAEAPPTDPGVPAFVKINCTGTANGVYQVSFTSAPWTWNGLGYVTPSGPWTVYPGVGNLSLPEPGLEAGTQTLQGKLSFGLDEYNASWPGSGCQYYRNCTFTPTFVQVCAQPGAGPFTEQSGVCTGNLENPAPQCVVVPVAIVSG